MSYYANGSGSIRFKAPLGKEVFDLFAGYLNEIFEEVYPADDERQEISVCGYFKYHEDEVEELLRDHFTNIMVEAGDLRFVGEDDAQWRFVFRDGKWIEEDGEVLFGITSAFVAFVKEVAARVPDTQELLQKSGFARNQLEELGLGEYA